MKKRQRTKGFQKVHRKNIKGDKFTSQEWTSGSSNMDKLKNRILIKENFYIIQKQELKFRGQVQIEMIKENWKITHQFIDSFQPSFDESPIKEIWSFREVIWESHSKWNSSDSSLLGPQGNTPPPLKYNNNKHNRIF